MQSARHIRFITATILMLLHTTSSNKPNARPVYETINEHARIDDNVQIFDNPSILPYGNPLAGNKNARIHISNQQAMFNAEKIRQHKAQLQRLTQAPRLDSYMRAYHESQDNHQLAIEQQQATQRDNAVTKPTIISRTQNTPVPKLKTNPKKRTQNIPDNSHIIQNINHRQEIARKNPPPRKTDDFKSTKYRGQRSYGAVEYQQYLNPQTHPIVYLNAIKDQGVAIKPNGNVGVTALKDKVPSKLHTEAIPSNTKNIYPKQYGQMQYYKTINEAEALNLLSKNNAGLTAYTSLDNSELNHIPLDFYFYLKNPSKSVSDLYDQTNTIGNTYASAYMSDYTAKDHTPITENVDDIEDPNASKTIKPFIPQPPTSPTPALDETTTTKTNHYYKIEVASQVLTSKHMPDNTKEVLYYKQEEDHAPQTQVLHYPSYPVQTDDKNNRYIHNNAQSTGVQHLSGDGIGVTAFGDDVSMNKTTNIKNRQKRADLHNEAFLLPSETEPDTTTTTDNPMSEPLIRLNPPKKFNNNNFNVFVSPNVPIGNSDDDYFQGEQESDTYYDEYNDYDDNLGDDVGATNIRPIINVDTNYHLDAPHGYANKFKYKANQIYGISPNHRNHPQTRPFRYQSFNQLYNNERHNLPIRYGIPRVNTLPNLDDILEPVYMITQSELKQLLNNQKLNIEHLDVFQIPKPSKPKRVASHPKYHKRSPYRYKNYKIRNKLHKLHRFI